CGELRAQAANLKTAAQVEEQLAASIADATRPKHAAAAKEATAQAKALEKKLAAACAPRSATIAAIPLRCLPVAPGHASHPGLDLADRWALSLTTQAGAASGVVFADPATVAAPSDMRLDSDAHRKELGDEKTGVLVVAALDAQLTVEEPQPGRGAWRIDVRGK